MNLCNQRNKKRLVDNLRADTNCTKIIAMLFRLNVAKNKSLITGLMYTTQNAPALLMLPHTRDSLYQ